MKGMNSKKTHAFVLQMVLALCVLLVAGAPLVINAINLDGGGGDGGGSYQCSDGYDNDGNGLVDFSEDPGCNSLNDLTECCFVPSQPNLTINTGALTPSTATQNSSVTLSATVTNATTVATPTGFYTLFQKANDASGTGATDIGTYYRASYLPASQTFAATLSYIFTAQGTSYIRACADKSAAANTGVITESNENDNCHPWMAVTVSAPLTECNDGIDNDGNGPKDWPADLGCSTSSDPTEAGYAPAQCENTIDDDNDGRIDLADYGCTASSDTTEYPNPQCSDGVDNDLNGVKDYSADLGCSTYTDDTESGYTPPPTPSSGVIIFDGDRNAMYPYVRPDAFTNGGIPLNDTSGIAHGYPTYAVSSPSPTGQRFCYLVDPTGWPSAWSTGGYNSPSDNTMVAWNGSLWYRASANTFGNVRYTYMTCRTYAPPDTSLLASASGVPAASSITVASGTPVTLTWYSQYGQKRQGTFSSANFSMTQFVAAYCQTTSVLTCEPDYGGGNTNPTTNQLVMAHRPQLAAAGSCWYQDQTTCYPDQTIYQPYGGSFSFTATTTKTYIYSGTNSNGTNASSAIVTVTTPLPSTPTGLTSSCNAAGTQVTLSWTPVAEASSYNVRLNYTANDTGSCSGGWNCATPPDYSSNGTTTTSSKYLVTTGAAYQWWVHSVNGNGTSATSTIASVTCSGQSDLTISGGVTVTAGTPATAGIPVTLSSTVLNSGSGSTGAGFATRFERATDSAGTNATTIGTYTRGSAVAAGGSFAATLDYTFPSSLSPVTWYVRACADSGGVITESNEGNNCAGSWTAISFAASPQCANGQDDDSDSLTDYGGGAGNDPGCANLSDTTENSENVNPPWVILSAATSPIFYGQSTTLSWTSGYVSSCTSSDFATGNLANSTAPVTVSPTVTKQYNINCTSIYGTSVFSSATVTVNAPGITITSTKPRVRKGETVTINWSVQGTVTSCSVSGTGISSSASTGSQSVTINDQTTYTMRCTAPGYTSQNSVTVYLIPDFTEQ